MRTVWYSNYENAALMRFQYITVLAHMADKQSWTNKKYSVAWNNK